MRFKGSQVLNQVYETEVAVKGRCETTGRQSQYGAEYLVISSRILGPYQCQYSNRFGLPWCLNGTSDFVRPVYH